MAFSRSIPVAVGSIEFYRANQPLVLIADYEYQRKNLEFFYNGSSRHSTSLKEYNS
jgi:hypothetical protein